jgi:quercetin dioxygenase-like cupin family protein
MGKFIIPDLPSRGMAPGITLREAHLQKVMVSFIHLQPGAIVQEHRHPHEQISVVISGRLKMTLAGETATLEAGQGLLVPSNALHSAVALEVEVWAYDSFSPIREDYVMS